MFIDGITFQFFYYFPENVLRIRVIPWKVA